VGSDFETRDIPYDDVFRLDRNTWAFVRLIGDRLAVVRMVRNARISIRMNWGTAAG